MCNPGDRVISISIRGQLETIIYDGELKSWTDDHFYCIEVETARVVKFPINTIERVTESYGFHHTSERKKENE